MLEVEVEVRHGGFSLQAQCRFDEPWTVIFGPSGAGKSTLLRLIAGLDRPDRGRILINGQIVTDAVRGTHRRPGRLRCGLVTQKPALFPHLSVADNIGYGLPHLAKNERREHIAFMLQLTGAGALADRPVRTLSGGEAQRVALARTLAPMPRLVLLDEPLSAIGGEARDALLTDLRRWLAEREIQTILVTHDAVDALATDAEVALIHEGRIVALGPASTVLAAERQRLLARLQSS
jgi:ABC-type sulfate/molybdate transport systems ATPase subunit